jgi:hypothetical protein
MKERKNIYFLDDICIILSYLLFALFIYRIYPVLKMWMELGKIDTSLFQLRSFQWLIITGGIFLSALFLQFYGRVVRRKEKELLKMIKTITLYKSITLHSLAYNTQIPEEKLEKLTRELERGGHLPISLEGRTVKLLIDPPVTSGTERGPDLEDSSFRKMESSQERATGEEPFTSSSSSMSESTSIPLKRREQDQGRQRERGQKKFNLLLFFFLFIVFWPLALLYVMRFAIANSARSAMAAHLEELKQGKGR